MGNGDFPVGLGIIIVATILGVCLIVGLVIGSLLLSIT